MNNINLKYFLISMSFSFLVIILILGLITVEINVHSNISNNFLYNLDNLNNFIIKYLYYFKNFFCRSFKI